MWHSQADSIHRDPMRGEPCKKPGQMDVANSSIRCNLIDFIKLHYHLDVPLRWGRLKGWEKRQRGTSVL